MNDEQIRQFTTDHNLPGWEGEEAIDIQKIREQLEKGEDVPERIKATLEIMDAIDLQKLVNTPPDKPLHAYLREQVPTIQKFTIDTEEARIEIHFREENAHGGAIAFPIDEEGNRVFIETLSTADDTTPGVDTDLLV